MTTILNIDTPKVMHTLEDVRKQTKWLIENYMITAVYFDNVIVEGTKCGDLSLFYDDNTKTITAKNGDFIAGPFSWDHMLEWLLSVKYVKEATHYIG